MVDEQIRYMTTLCPVFVSFLPYYLCLVLTSITVFSLYNLCLLQHCYGDQRKHAVAEGCAVCHYTSHAFPSEYPLFALLSFCYQWLLALSVYQCTEFSMNHAVGLWAADVVHVYILSKDDS